MFVTRSASRKSLDEVQYVELAGFSNGLLPTRKQIIQNMMYLLRPSRAGKGQRSKDTCAFILAEIIAEHWLFCNVYTIGIRHIKLKILDLYQNFVSLVQTRGHRKNKAYYTKVENFNKEADRLFDIFCVSEVTRKRLERINGVKMEKEEWDFLTDQRADRKMFCESFVDRKWENTMARRRKDLQRLEEPINKSMQDEKVVMEAGGLAQEIYPETSESSVATKRPKLTLECVRDGKMPERYKHLRPSERKVRPEVYETIDKLVSVYHMSRKQAEAAIVNVGNHLFGRNWKMNSESKIADLDTLPHSRNSRLIGKSIEALALKEIVMEMMSLPDKSVVTYSDDGSKKQGVGGFTVQGVTIKGVFRALPTLQIASETRDNLAHLKLTVLEILEAVSGVAQKTLYEKIDFVLTDQASHNMKVTEIVSAKLDTNYKPHHLFCNVHPTLMFNRVITKCWGEIESTIGRDKIYSQFLVNATTNSSTVGEQALDCMTRLINHDFDHKPWNKSKEFDSYIAPKKNKSVSLKDERFNRLTLTCAITLHHLEDVAGFLNKFENVTNQLACIVRCFIDLDFFRAFFCAGALIGLHLVEPFLSLTTLKSTTYSKLIPAFQQLYLNLTTVNPEDFLNIQVPALKFVSKDCFDYCKYDSDVRESVGMYAESMRSEVAQILALLLPELAEGFRRQKGDIFGFGTIEGSSDFEQALSNMDPVKLNTAPVHNLNAERSVGFINYELARRGAKQLSVASSAQVKAKSSDLLENVPSGSYRPFKKFITKGGKIPEILKKWNSLQEELLKKGLREKEIANISVEKRRNKDLAALKVEGGPFTSGKEVDEFLSNSDISEVDKQKRLYLEVRYARDTSLTLPKTSDVFRLKKDHKNLPYATYSINLKTYLDNICYKANVADADFQQALDFLSGHSVSKS